MIRHARAVLFGGNVAVEDMDDAVEVGNQCPDLLRFLYAAWLASK